MKKVFDKIINGVNYTFYRTPLFGEIVYNVSILRDMNSTVFIMRRKNEEWKIVRQDDLPDFVYKSEFSLSDTIIENEKGE
ncbi:MAG: hypothetical protein ACJ75B_08135 [Flavisolibacter sp.]|jgi:hypothetical protein